MNALIIAIIALLAGTGAIPVSPMSVQLERQLLVAEEGSESENSIPVEFSWEYFEFQRDYDIQKVSEQWSVVDGKVLLEVQWHATSKTTRMYTTYPPSYPPTTHVVWKEFYGVVDGHFQLVQIDIGEYVEAEEATIIWPEE